MKKQIRDWLGITSLEKSHKRLLKSHKEIVKDNQYLRERILDNLHKRKIVTQALSIYDPPIIKPGRTEHEYLEGYNECYRSMTDYFQEWVQNINDVINENIN